MPLSWVDAKQQCQHNEGGLVTINSYEEYWFTLHILRSNENGLGNVQGREFVFAGMHFNEVSITAKIQI